MPRIPEWIGRVGRGLWGSLRRLAYLFGMAALIGLISALIALPLWYLASLHRRIYTAGVLAAATAALALAVIRRTGRAVQAHGGVRGYVRGVLLPILKAAGFAVASLAVLYGAALLAGTGAIVPAVAAVGGWILLLGLLRYGRKKSP